MKIHNGIVEVIGKWPKHRPYVSIRSNDDAYLCSIDKRQMDALCRRWKNAFESEKAREPR